MNRLTLVAHCHPAQPELPEPCFLPVAIDNSGEIVSVCHRLSGHDGLCSDWAPDECIVADCACTEIECAQCAEDLYRGTRTPHVCDPEYVRCGHFDVSRPTSTDNTYRCNQCGAAL